MNSKDKNILYPPKTADIWELWDYFWDHGLGRPIPKDGIVKAWNAFDLETAVNGKPSQRALDDWRSRKRLPSVRHLRRLCSCVFTEQPLARRAWEDAFLSARRAEELKRKSSPTTETDPLLPENANPPAPVLNRRLYLTAASIVFVIGAIGVSSINTDQPTPKISDIKFCLLDQFSEKTKKCINNQTSFASDTQKIYVSFKSDNIPYKAPFSRRWYRNGEKFLERKDFFDETWKNYTWLHNKHGHDRGEYHMRIIIEDEVFTGRFTVGH